MRLTVYDAGGRQLGKAGHVTSVTVLVGRVTGSRRIGIVLLFHAGNLVRMTGGVWSTLRILVSITFRILAGLVHTRFKHKGECIRNHRDGDDGGTDRER